MKRSEIIDTVQGQFHSADRDLSQPLADPEITALIFDSREVIAGAAFFAIPGSQKNGADFIEDAVIAGASLVIFQDGEEIPGSVIHLVNSQSSSANNVALVSVNDIRFALAYASNVFYQQPSSKSLVCGITGTNGKTSTAWLLSQIASGLNMPALYLGTLGAYIFKGSEVKVWQEEGRTTLDSVSIHRLLRDSELAGVSFSALEVTSHGLDQKRTASIDWDIAAFSNITQDHLDYHGDFESYKKAKSRLFFDELVASKKSERFAVINVDDRFGRELAARILEELAEVALITVSEQDPGADLFLASCISNDGGSDLKIIFEGEEYECSTNLIGGFNITNLFLAMACAVASGFPLDSIITVIKMLLPVPGRLELVTVDPVKVFVDYAHTPDALDKIQTVLRGLLTEESGPDARGRLITVFGCGGDRDKSKRPIMGASVARLSDVGIITSDNPRTENPVDIINEIESGVIKYAGKNSDSSIVDISDVFKYEKESERRLAIHRALEIARAGDVILVAGKGHEPYQEIQGTKHPFDDREVIKEEIRKIEER